MWDSLQSIQCSGKIKKDWDDAMKKVLLSRIEKVLLNGLIVMSFVYVIEQNRGIVHFRYKSR